MTDRPRASRRRQQELADDLTSGFIAALLHEQVHDAISEDTQLAWLCDAATTISIASDLRERADGEDDEYVEQLNAAWGDIDYIAHQRAHECIADACTTLLTQSEQSVSDGHWGAAERREAKHEAREWLFYHTSE